MSLGDDLRDEGIDRVSKGRKEWLGRVRAWAWDYARNHGSVSANDLRNNFVLPEGAHPNLWGAVFHGAGLKPEGTTKNKAVASAHSRSVKVWVIPEDEETQVVDAVGA